MLLVFGVLLRWFPVGAYVAFTEDPLGYLRQLTLPAVTLAFNLLGVVGRIARGSILEVLHQDYVRTARSKGLGEARVLSRHVLRTALIPIVTVVGVQFGILIGGTVLVEYIFNYAGMPDDVAMANIGLFAKSVLPVLNGIDTGPPVGRPVTAAAR